MDIRINPAPHGPIMLKSTRVWRTYIGGRRLDELHSTPTPSDDHFPEEWIASTVPARNVGREHIVDEGLSFLATQPGLSLREVISTDPAAFLGEGRTDMGVLIKLIDSCERLTIQVHPDKSTAKALFATDYGKTECWYILGGRTIGGEPPHIYLGFKPGVDKALWKCLFDTQNITGMLDCLHRFDVKPGDCFFIEGGTPHAISAGCFLAEIQEPTDLTIRTERITPSGLSIADTMCHQGLGFDRMMDCFHYEGGSKADATRRWKIPAQVLTSVEGGFVTNLIGYMKTPLLKMDEVIVREKWSLGPSLAFSVLYLMQGKGKLVSSQASIEVAAGSQVFLPAQMDGLTAISEGGVSMRWLHCFGPNRGNAN